MQRWQPPAWTVVQESALWRVNLRRTVAMMAVVQALAVSSAAASTNVVATGFVAVTNGSGSMQISAFRLDDRRRLPVREVN
jgi:ABC-type cobalamin transport system permease subunit